MQDYSRKQLKKYRLTVITLSIISLILLMIVIINVSISDNKTNFCSTKKCLQTAIRSQLKLEELNCHKNNYSSCIILQKRNRQQNKELIKSQINTIIVDFFKKPVGFSDTSSTKLVKNFYKACTNEEIHGEVSLETIFKYLGKVGLPKIPSFLLNIDSDSFDVMKISANSKRILGIDLFFGLELVNENIVLLTTNNTFAKHPYNPSLFDNKPIETIHEYNAIKDIFKATTNEYFKTVLDSENVTVDNLTINNASDILWDMMGHYKQFSLFNNISGRNLKILEETNDIQTYLKFLLVDIENCEKIDVYYFERELEFIMFLKGLPKSKLELFSWFKIVSTLISSSGRLENNKFGSFRTKNCYNLTVEFLGTPLLSSIIDGNFLHNTKVKIYDMILNIKAIFRKMISQRKDLHPFYREKYINVLDDIKYKIGAPFWILNQTRVLENYKNIRVTRNTHIDNIVSIMRSETFKKLNIICKDTHDAEEWPKITDVLIKFDGVTNTIKIPFAVLMPPIFDLDVSSIEYGALGPTIAKELWIDLRDLGYVNQDVMKLPFDKFYANKKSSGQTLNDEISIYIALEAYKIFLETHHHEDILPGFQDFSNEDMFFLGTLFSI